MQTLLLLGLVLLTSCSNALSQETLLSLPGADSAVNNAQAAVEKPLPDYKGFRDRLTAAVEARDMAALQALYQTNGVNAQQLDKELSRWKPMLEEDPNSRLSIQSQMTMFRDFNRSSKMWKNLAERLTTQKSTHLVQLMTIRGNRRNYWMLPLVEVDGRLFLLPSDKSTDMSLRWEDDQPPDGSRPAPSTTNSTSRTAGPER